MKIYAPVARDGVSPIEYAVASPRTRDGQTIADQTFAFGAASAHGILAGPPVAATASAAGGAAVFASYPITGTVLFASHDRSMIAFDDDAAPAGEGWKDSAGFLAGSPGWQMPANMLGADLATLRVEDFGYFDSGLPVAGSVQAAEFGDEIGSAAMGWGIASGDFVGAIAAASTI